MIKIYLWSKTIHRMFLFATSFLIIFMSITGSILKFSFFSKYVSIDMGLVRVLHNDLSVYFVISVGIMMLTGLYMYFFPILKKTRK
jgi:hypothetical protein